MSNKSIAQTLNEVGLAKKQALRDPYVFERPDHMVGNKNETGHEHLGNSLSDLIKSKEKSQPLYEQALAAMKGKIESIFDRYPHQYNLLGLYYAARFTMEEISEMIGYPKGHISRDLTRAKTRLRKSLTTTEYDSIRWAIGDVKSLQATERIDDSEYENAKSTFAPSKTFLVEGSLNVHPPNKILPVPKWVTLGLTGGDA